MVHSIRLTLTSCHSKFCAIQAYKNACAKAGPVLTGTYHETGGCNPEENMGDVIGDLNKRRGQVEGMESSRSGAVL